MDKVSTSSDPEKSLTHLLEECRMVLPGIQALFGFQLVAVFETPFKKLLGESEQMAHFAAMLMVAVAVGLVMAPASFHRISERGQVSEGYLRLASRLLGIGMGCLVIGTVTDVYLIGRIILGDAGWAGIFAGVIFAVLCGLWFIAPWIRSRRVRA